MIFRHYKKRVINKLTSISVTLKAKAVQVFRIAKRNQFIISIYLFFFILGLLRGYFWS
jgi:hypothetical protein